MEPLNDMYVFTDDRIAYWWDINRLYIPNERGEIMDRSGVYWSPDKDKYARHLLGCIRVKQAEVVWWGDNGLVGLCTGESYVAKNGWVHNVYINGPVNLLDKLEVTGYTVSTDQNSSEFPSCSNIQDSVSNGSTAAYYHLPKGAEELQDLISYKSMNAQLGEIFREAYRYGEASHSDCLRGVKKIIYYAEAELNRLNKYG